MPYFSWAQGQMVLAMALMLISLVASAREAPTEHGSTAALPPSTLSLPSSMPPRSIAGHITIGRKVKSKQEPQPKANQVPLPTKPSTKLREQTRTIVHGFGQDTKVTVVQPGSSVQREFELPFPPNLDKSSLDYKSEEVETKTKEDCEELSHELVESGPLATNNKSTSPRPIPPSVPASTISFKSESYQFSYGEVTPDERKRAHETIARSMAPPHLVGSDASMDLGAKTLPNLHMPYIPRNSLDHYRRSSKPSFSPKDPKKFLRREQRYLQRAEEQINSSIPTKVFFEPEADAETSRPRTPSLASSKPKSPSIWDYNDEDYEEKWLSKLQDQESTDYPLTMHLGVMASLPTDKARTLMRRASLETQPSSFKSRSDGAIESAKRVVGFKVSEKAESVTQPSSHASSKPAAPPATAPGPSSSPRPLVQAIPIPAPMQSRPSTPRSEDVTEAGSTRVSPGATMAVSSPDQATSPKIKEDSESDKNVLIRALEKLSVVAPGADGGDLSAGSAVPVGSADI